MKSLQSESREKFRSDALHFTRAAGLTYMSRNTRIRTDFCDSHSGSEQMTRQDRRSGWPARATPRHRSVQEELPLYVSTAILDASDVAMLPSSRCAVVCPGDGARGRETLFRREPPPMFRVQVAQSLWPVKPSCSAGTAGASDRDSRHGWNCASRSGAWGKSEA